MHPQSPELRALAEKWENVPAGERSNFQSYATELCEALGVERPRPAGTGYEFEYAVTTTDRKSGKDTTNFIDLYRQGHFILLAVRGETPETDGQRAIIHAYAQAKRYARDVPHNPPPYVMVMEVGCTLRLWDRWSGEYKPLPAVRRFDLRTLRNEHDIEFLRTVWEDPESLNPWMIAGVEVGIGRDGLHQAVLPVGRAAVGAFLESMMNKGSGFTFYDPLYPSPSDPGAYISYSPRNGVWGMTLGNHGWSGGIYEVQPQVICAQLQSLRSKGLLEAVDLEPVRFFSHYAPESLSANERMSRMLLEIHR